MLLYRGMKSRVYLSNDEIVDFYFIIGFFDFKISDFGCLCYIVLFWFCIFIEFLYYRIC